MAGLLKSQELLEDVFVSVNGARGILRQYGMGMTRQNSLSLWRYEPGIENYVSWRFGLAAILF